MFMTELTWCNYHKIQLTIDASNQVTSPTHIDKIVCIKDGDIILQYTLNENIATITTEGYGENDVVDVWLFCMCKSENGGICEVKLDAARKQKIQDYYDML